MINIVEIIFKFIKNNVLEISFKQMLIKMLKIFINFYSIFKKLRGKRSPASHMLLQRKNGNFQIKVNDFVQVVYEMSAPSIVYIDRSMS